VIKLVGQTASAIADGSGQHFVDVAVLNQPVADVRVIIDDTIDVTVSQIHHI